MKKRNILFAIFATLTLAFNILIIVESCIGGTGSAEQSQGLTEMIVDFVILIDPGSTIINNIDIAHSVIRKLIGHFLLFGLSGLFTSLTMIYSPLDKIKKIHKFIFGLVFGFIIAAISELIQYFVPGRAGMITDILIDFSGFLLFYLIIYGILCLINKRRRTHE